ncbi:Hypothetical protein EHI5A_153600 [Entamoeba histolytica KU27]|uniref:Uncharacterized protein n=1 Tax=Entamoeba histolytica KU27 TaxID=885311 RepID=M2RH30_ENTHI|nr:Hypothetical protein EHI5A_153600 [Entamoeba histolytica KU27]
MLALFAILFVAYGQYTCSSATKFNLPQYHTSIVFGTNTPKSKIAPESGSLKEVQGQYFVTSVGEDMESLLVNINTCFATTNLPTEIYIFDSCSDEGVAQNKLAESGIDNSCSASSEYPIVNFHAVQGKTYYVLVKLVEENVDGTVSIAIDQSYEDNSHIECDVARSVPEENGASIFPYSDQAQIVRSQVPETKVECTTSAPTLWYKFKGDGKYIVINTCNYYTNFDTRLVVVDTLINGKCNGAKCVKFADDGCGKTSYSSILVLKTEAEKIYYVGVSAAANQEGQFEIRMDHLADSIPSVCSRALPIQELPFSRSFDIPDVWPTGKPSCISYHTDVRPVYLSFVGYGKPVVISTCKSVDSNLKPIGVAVELINNCEEEKCAVNTTNSKEFGLCGENNYLIVNMEVGKTYYIKAYCPDGPCDMTLNMYEKTASHDRCDIALELNNPGVFSEAAVISNLEESIHGCNSVAKTDPGLWYKFVHTKSITDEKYTIFAMNAQRSKIGYIEFSNGCMLIECESLQQGEAHLSFSSDEEYQLIFVYPDATDHQQALIVQFVSEESTPFYKCQDALDVQLPYTALHTFSNTKTRQICSGEMAPANYYRFSLNKDIGVDVSTCFPKTLVNTAVEITKGCYGEPTAKCIGSNTEGRGCAVGAAKLSVDLNANTQYTLSVYSEAVAALNVKQYRVVIFSLEIPKESVCDSAIVVPYQKYYADYLILNRLSYKTDFGSVGITRGSYFKVQIPDVAYTVTVRTCSSKTTMNSFVALYGKCIVQGSSDQPISVPNEDIGIASSSITNCDVHGTYLTFDTVPNKEYYVFVGPENFAEEGFVDVQFFMDAKEDPQPDDSSSVPPTPSSSTDDKDDDSHHSTPVGWIVFGVLVYVLFAGILAGCVIAIILKRRSSGYATLA